MARNGCLPILRSGYWDVPRCVCIQLPTATIALDSPFNEELDDYEPDYAVRVLPAMQERDFLGSRTTGFETNPNRRIHPGLTGSL
jgi:hypothetical protein